MVEEKGCTASLADRRAELLEATDEGRCRPARGRRRRGGAAVVSAAKNANLFLLKTRMGIEHEHEHEQATPI
jgi:hypothetical protein